MDEVGGSDGVCGDDRTRFPIPHPLEIFQLVVFVFVASGPVPLAVSASISSNFLPLISHRLAGIVPGKLYQPPAWLPSRVVFWTGQPRGASKDRRAPTFVLEELGSDVRDEDAEGDTQEGARAPARVPVLDEVDQEPAEDPNRRGPGEFNLPHEQVVYGGALPQA